MGTLNAKIIGDNLRQLREKKGKTVEEAANDLEITPSALSNYENGLRIPRDTIKIRIANYYNRSITNIFYAKNTHNP